MSPSYGLPLERPLAAGWQYAALPSGAATEPDGIEAFAPQWIEAQVPGTAAGALRTAGEWSLEGDSRDFDAEDGWWRCTFDCDADEPAECWLRFDGLATVADVWLNGERILHSENQFLSHEVNVVGRLQRHNVLYLRCAALSQALKVKRSRPRWKTRLVRDQQLRWWRTSLLGRIPAWSPPVAATGPWRGVTLVYGRGVRVLQTDLRSRLVGTDRGAVEVHLQLALSEALPLRSAELRVGDARAPLTLHCDEDNVWHLGGTLDLDAVRAWWPHTHGNATLYPVSVRVEGPAGPLDLHFGRTGFRRIEVDAADGGFTIKVNDVALFCRGACWMPPDIATLDADDTLLHSSLDLFKDAGFNMLRVVGTTIYESPRFYEACAERGIMVWQDFCFANMDYPGEDPAFVDSVREEAVQFLQRTQLNPALSVLCGNSEIEQQVTMLGQPPGLAGGPLFRELLPQLSHQYRPDLPYVGSSPSGGALPFQVDTGVSHYFGVGAYQRPLDDARRANLRFTAECLAFANVPEPETVNRLLRDGEAPPQHPRWKQRVARDAGVGWDFDDVRDHYLEQVLGVDSRQLRYTDPDRYLYLSRLTSAEVMSAAFQEWRRLGSPCQGALVWFWRDLWLGAGWGLVDATGLPKAPYYALKRVCAPRALMITDEGLNGLALHAVNDQLQSLNATVQLRAYRDGDVLIASGERALQIAGRSGVTLNSGDLIGQFTDLTYAYRFGPPMHDVTLAQLIDTDTGSVLSTAVHGPQPARLLRDINPDLHGVSWRCRDGSYRLQIRSHKFAFGVWVDAPGFMPSDNYFHLAPGEVRILEMTARRPEAHLQAWLHAANAPGATRVNDARVVAEHAA